MKRANASQPELGQHVSRKKRRSRIAVVIVCAIVIVFCAGSLAVIKTLHDRNFSRADRPQFAAYLRYEDIPQYDKKIVHFKSGQNTLTGYLYRNGGDRGLVVVAHGLGAGAESYLPEIVYFVDQGWAVFAYDCTGSHASEGKGTVGLAQSVLDLHAALAYVESNAELRGLPIMLFGHSWGGFAVASVLNYDHPVTAVASVAGYNSPMKMVFEEARAIMGWFAYVEYPIMWAYQTMLFGRTAWMSAVDGINRTDTPVMIIHGDRDGRISYNGAAIIAHRNQITNRNVVYKTCSEEGRNGHSNLFYTEAALKHRAQKNQEYKELYDQYNGNLPDNAKAAYYAGVDRFKTSELDPGFMGDINEFFEDALRRRI